ncbi:MAG: type VI secretion system-associated FHA domain protein TagH, partial [Gammaproteobacteria bacterium]|nr:type VI secretion system-associated FHA domain protein TagH [Gammaproteobacteria bacterium]
SSHKDGLGSTSTREFGIHGGTIGRSAENDWVLPDSRRYVSSRHCTIDFRSGCYYLIDTSTNGVYVNGADTPVARGKPQRLFAGDQLRVGEYDISVQIEGDPTMELLAHDNHRDPVDRAHQVAPPDPTRDDLLGVSDIAGGVGFSDLLNEDAEEEAIRLAAERAAASLSLDDSRNQQAPNRRRAAAASSRSARQRRKRDSSTTASRTLTRSPQLEAFFRGAGLEADYLDSRQTEVLMQRVGQLVRELVRGITESLHVRAEQKNALRLSHTTIQPHSNNPLKFSAAVDEALGNLLFEPSGAYLAPVEAVREAFDDITMHQVSLLTSMQAALRDYLERLDPDELEQRFDNGMKRSGLLGAANKARYWELYRELYQVVAQHSPGTFPRGFSDELARAYEQEVARLTRQRSPSARKKKPAA